MRTGNLFQIVNIFQNIGSEITDKLVFVGFFAAFDSSHKQNAHSSEEFHTVLLVLLVFFFVCPSVMSNALGQGWDKGA